MPESSESLFKSDVNDDFARLTGQTNFLPWHRNFMLFAQGKGLADIITGKEAILPRPAEGAYLTEPSGKRKMISESQGLWESNKAAYPDMDENEFEMKFGKREDDKPNAPSWDFDRALSKYKLAIDRYERNAKKVREANVLLAYWVSPTIRGSLLSFEDPTKAYEFLCQQYRMTDRRTREKATSKLERAHLSKSKSVQGYLNYIEQQVQDIIDAKGTYTDDMIITKILIGLTPAYANFVDNFDMFRDDNPDSDSKEDLKKLKSRLLTFESRLNTDRTSTRGGNYTANNVETSNHQEGTRKKCTFDGCKKWGHEEHQCWVKFPHLKTTDNKQKRRERNRPAAQEVIAEDSEHTYITAEVLAKAENYPDYDPSYPSQRHQHFITEEWQEAFTGAEIYESSDNEYESRANTPAEWEEDESVGWEENDSIGWDETPLPHKAFYPSPHPDGHGWFTEKDPADLALDLDHAIMCEWFHFHQEDLPIEKACNPSGVSLPANSFVSNMTANMQNCILATVRLQHIQAYFKHYTTKNEDINIVLHAARSISAVEEPFYEMQKQRRGKKMLDLIKELGKDVCDTHEFGQQRENGIRKCRSCINAHNLRVCHKPTKDNDRNDHPKYELLEFEDWMLLEYINDSIDRIHTYTGFYSDWMITYCIKMQDIAWKAADQYDAKTLIAVDIMLQATVNRMHRTHQPIQIANNVLEEDHNVGSENWIIDSGANIHVCKNRTMFQTLDSTKATSVVTASNKGVLALQGRGTVALTVKGPTGKTTRITLTNVAYAPTARHNLISLPVLARKGDIKGHFSGNSITLTTKNNLPIVIAPINHFGLYELSTNTIAQHEKARPKHLAQTIHNYSLPNFVRPPFIVQVINASDPVWLWHRRLGHLGLQNMIKLIKMSNGTNLEAKEVQQKLGAICPTCAATKAGIRLQKEPATRRFEQTGGLVHVDTWFHNRKNTSSKTIGSVNMTDDATRFTEIIEIRTKADTAQQLINLIKRWKTAYSITIRIIRADNEFTRNETLQVFTNKEGIKLEGTAPHAHHQNGTAERVHRTGRERSAAMLYDTNMPKQARRLLEGVPESPLIDNKQNFVMEAFRQGMWCKNRAPSRALRDKTPWECFFGQTPNMENERAWGTTAFVTFIGGQRTQRQADHGKQLADRAWTGVFMGSENEANYRIWNPAKDRIEIVEAINCRVDDKMPSEAWLEVTEDQENETDEHHQRNNENIEGTEDLIGEDTSEEAEENDTTANEPPIRSRFFANMVKTSTATEGCHRCTKDKRPCDGKWPFTTKCTRCLSQAMACIPYQKPDEPDDDEEMSKADIPQEQLKCHKCTKEGRKCDGVYPFLNPCSACLKHKKYTNSCIPYDESLIDWTKKCYRCHDRNRKCDGEYPFDKPCSYCIQMHKGSIGEPRCVTWEEGRSTIGKVFPIRVDHQKKCIRCRNKKLACDGNSPCNKCVETNKACKEWFEKVTYNNKCRTCKRHHRRCDGKQPCPGCTKSGQLCVYDKSPQEVWRHVTDATTRTDRYASYTANDGQCIACKWGGKDCDGNLPCDECSKNGGFYGLIPTGYCSFYNTDYTHRIYIVDREAYNAHCEKYRARGSQTRQKRLQEAKIDLSSDEHDDEDQDGIPKFDLPPLPPLEIPDISDSIQRIQGFDFAGILIDETFQTPELIVREPGGAIGIVNNVQLLSPEPRTLKEAFASEEADQWKQAYEDELQSLTENETWKVIDASEVTKGSRPLSCKPVFKRKFGPDGTIARHKIRLVARGFLQVEGIDFDETFASVVKPPSYKFMFAVATYKGWKVYHYDIKTAYLYGVLDEPILMYPPAGSKDALTNKVYLLKKAIYGLKQSGRQWYKTFKDKITQHGWTPSTYDQSVFIHSSGIIMTLYVDDINIFCPNPESATEVKEMLERYFKVSDLGECHHYLGIQIERNNGDTIMHQGNFIDQMLERFGMTDIRPVSTPMETTKKTQRTTNENQIASPQIKANYQAKVGCINYLACCTRLDISYETSYVSRFCSNPQPQHVEAVNRILAYLKGTKTLGIKHQTSQKDLPLKELTTMVKMYVDSDWAGCVDTRRSTSGWVLTFNNSPISWSAKRQKIVALSSCEAEYIAAAEAAKEAIWFMNFAEELNFSHSYFKMPMLIDNTAAMKLSKNPEFHSRSKHIDIRYHFLRDQVLAGRIDIKRIHTRLNVADLFTKPLARLRHFELLNQMNMHYERRTTKELEEDENTEPQT